MNNKKIIFQVTKTYMKKNKRRTVITFAGILVMVILMTAVFVGKDTIMNFMQRAVEEENGKWHVQIYGVGKEAAEEIGNLDGVETVNVSRPLGYTDFKESGNPEETPMLELKGYSGELFDLMNMRLVEGRYPENDHEILISERAVKEGSTINVGDTIEVNAYRRYIHAFISETEQKKLEKGEEIGGVGFFSGFNLTHGETVEVPDHFPYYESNDIFEMIHEPTGLKGTYTVVGIMQSPYYEKKGQGGYIAITKTDAEVKADETVNLVLTIDLNSKHNPVDDMYRIIDKYRDPEEREELLKNGGRKILEDGTEIPLKEDEIVENNMLMTFGAKGSDGSFNFLMIFFQAFFIILITAASLILIYNVFAMSYKERSRYLGMLSSVGATRKQKKWSVYYEVFSLLMIAIPVGIAIGLLAVKGVMALLYPHFSLLINRIATNVISGKSCEIPCTLVVNPLNIFFVIVFSILAVYISALIPARKISKVGPIESIRGNDTGIRRRRGGYKTKLGFMKKGKSEQMLAAVSVGRNRYSTRGIIRSIVAFITLTLITAFAVRSFVDILRSKTEKDVLSIGKNYEGYSYIYSIDDDERFAEGLEDISTSDEVEDYKKIDATFFTYNISLDYYSQEFKDSLEKVISSYFPNGIPDGYKKWYTEPEDIYDNPSANIITMSEEDFKDVAEKAGIDLSKYDESDTALIYDTISVSTDEYRFGDSGAVKPDYMIFQVKNPIDITEGEKVTLLGESYDEKTDEVSDYEVPVTFAGYIDAEDIGDYFTLRGSDVWIIIPEKTKERISNTESGAYQRGINDRYVLFSVKSEDAGIIGRLSMVKNEFGDSALQSAVLISGMTDFKTAITSIVKIVAVSFTILIAIICILNLYNSVMGRKLTRHQELSVLFSMGMTGAQKRRMLILENVRLMVRALVYSGVITSIFVVSLHKVLSDRFGRMYFTLPVWIMALTAVVSIGALTLFTAISYKGTGKTQLIEEVRTEAV